MEQKTPEKMHANIRYFVFLLIILTPLYCYNYNAGVIYMATMKWWIHRWTKRSRGRDQWSYWVVSLSKWATVECIVKTRLLCAPRRRQQIQQEGTHTPPPAANDDGQLIEWMNRGLRHLLFATACEQSCHELEFDWLIDWTGNIVTNWNVAKECTLFITCRLSCIFVSK